MNQRRQRPLQTGRRSSLTDLFSLQKKFVVVENGSEMSLITLADDLIVGHVDAKVQITCPEDTVAGFGHVRLERT